MVHFIYVCTIACCLPLVCAPIDIQCMCDKLCACVLCIFNTVHVTMYIVLYCNPYGI